MAPSRLMHEGTTMFEMPDGISRLKSELEDFMANHIYPSEAEFYRQAEMLGPWAVFPIVEDLKAKARKRGLWNLRSEEHTSELQSLMSISYAVCCLTKKKNDQRTT